MVPDGRLKDVEKRIVWGSVSFLFDTNPIERDNLTRRLNVAKLHRKTLCFAKDKTVLHYQIALDRNMQNFCRTPVPLKQEIPLQERQGKKNTIIEHQLCQLVYAIMSGHYRSY